MVYLCQRAIQNAACILSATYSILLLCVLDCCPLVIRMRWMAGSQCKRLQQQLERRETDMSERDTSLNFFVLQAVAQ